MWNTVRPVSGAGIWTRVFLIKFTGKTVGLSRIWTQIVGVEGKQADHLTSSATAHFNFYFNVLSSFFIAFGTVPT